MPNYPFVSVDWLQTRLGEPGLVVLDGSYYLPTMGRDADAEFLAGHIPGALRFDIDEIKDRSNDLPHMLPDEEFFAKSVGALGIDDDTRIVVYDGAGLFSAPRVWWMFTVFGARDVKILEGGFPAWLKAGLPVEKGAERTPEPRRFTARFDSSAVADLAFVKSALADPAVQVVDARPAPRFRGEAPEPRPGLPSGRMPGSRNLPFADVIDDGRLRDPDAIREALARQGIDPSQPVVTSCGSGVSAAILYLALMRIGAPPKALYDGSWAEWASQPDAPIETG
ncbi:MAG: 3-mercaptopyruvate sulfurtransferase [Salinarimonadaceae bacterium]|nr:MAG: 3-mercaptopyruvate sulfurtransferase [Salinarimonadaceae bacterium]